MRYASVATTMIFRLRDQDGSIDAYPSQWTPKELELEKCLLPRAGDEPLLQESVFREPLLLISNQVRTRESKRADILALDQAGSAVIVELKRHQGNLGVETQALQYLADFSGYRGHDFLRRFSRDEHFTERIQGFLGDDFRLEDLNRGSRVILVAQTFDPALFSMGEWLARSGVAFRCIEYTPFEVHNERFLSFSIAFDRTPEPLYPLVFQNRAREPGTFWHNIGHPNSRRADDGWWAVLKKRAEISTGFENQPGDAGERILKSYVAGDKIVAYATGYGAVGWGIIERPTSYRLLRPGEDDDKVLGGHLHLHRLSITWKAVAQQLKDGLPPDEIRERFDIYHPVSTSVKIADRKAEALLALLSQRFSQA